MKRAILATLIGTFAFALASPDLTSWALGGSGGGKLQSGDINGDGNRSLSDAVYLLQYLFSGGPAPVESTEPMASPETVAEILDAAARIEERLPELESATVDSPLGTAIVDIIWPEILLVRQTPEWTESVAVNLSKRITFVTIIAKALRSGDFGLGPNHACHDLCAMAHQDCRNSCGANATCIMNCDLKLATCMLGCND